LEFVFDKNFDDNTDEEYFKSPRRSVATSFDEVEFNPPKRSKRKTNSAKPKMKYIGTTAKTKRWYSFPKLSWTKSAWLLAGFLVLRLFFMDSGILDYHQMEKTIQDREQTLVELRQENVQLIKEIKKIKSSSAYQKKMAREHLGVIAPNEYLVVFSK
tara:strand:- start:5663 stop:6133 length:471 start_codon:yes stop_codon:yes gene_type:complete